MKSRETLHAELTEFDPSDYSNKEMGAWLRDHRDDLLAYLAPPPDWHTSPNAQGEESMGGPGPRDQVYRDIERGG